MECFPRNEMQMNRGRTMRRGLWLASLKLPTQQRTAGETTYKFAIS